MPIETHYDREFASVVVAQDRAADVKRKWGRCSCFLPSAPGERVSYLYTVESADDRQFIRLEIDRFVEAITVSRDPPVAGVCYSPIRHTVQVRTGKGLRLGATIEDAIHLYGTPTRHVEEGPLVRLRYWAELDRLYEWDLEFRDGRLVEWVVATED